MSIWPDGHQSAAVVTINLDGESFEQPTLPGRPLWGRYSYGRYGMQIGVYRLLDALDRQGVRATFFLPAWDIERYPALMEEIASAGHELAARGYANERFNDLSDDEQHAVLDRGEAIFERAFGQRPTGFRAPSGAPELNTGRAVLAIPGPLMSARTRAILIERGYRYDSGYCDDDLAYIVEEGSGRLVELPVFPTASDRHYYALHRSPEVVAEAWREELSAMHEAGGLFNLTLHPRGDFGSGRAVRIRAVDAILQAIHETPNLWLTTCGEIADWWLK